MASDIHLGPETPKTAIAFHDFLDKACANADALILCGDIFDAWIGDDFAQAAPPDWLLRTLDKLGQFSTTTPLWIGRGNRDFLIGHALAQRVGAQLLPDKVCLDTDYGHVLLSHGDEYCTADASYQRFRRIVRTPFIQKAFLALSLTLRRGIADWARQRSMAANRNKSARIMDVETRAVEQAFMEYDVDTMVHGHTHRPAVHQHTVGGRLRQRIVLPDWDYDHGEPLRAGWVSIDCNGTVLHQQDW